MAIQIFAVTPSSRLNYVLETIFSKILNLEFVLHHQIDEYLKQSGPSINYSLKPTGKENEIIIPASGFLKEKIPIPAPEIFFYNSLPTGFEVQLSIEQKYWQFDFFAFTFWHLARCEEYEEFIPDQHQRFPAQSSHAFKNGYLKIPFIDLWSFHLADELKLNSIKEIKVLPSFDIDIAFAYLHKTNIQTIGGFLKDILQKNLTGFDLRIKTLSGRIKDPFDTMDWIIKILEPFPQSHFFILSGKRTHFDRNLSLYHPVMGELIKKIQKDFFIGIHPSYHSNSSIDILKKEIQDLSKITNQNITKSRQHYLKIKFPETFRNLIEVGIKEDFSMGYPDALGFRLGTSFPVNWYDFKKEKITSLILIPFSIMDVTLKKYLQISPEEACLEIDFILRNSSHLNFIWHNSNLSKIDKWEKWDSVLKYLLTFKGNR